MAMDPPVRKGRHYRQGLFLPQQAEEQVFVPEADDIAPNQSSFAILSTWRSFELYNVALRIRKVDRRTFAFRAIAAGELAGLQAIRL